MKKIILGILFFTSLQSCFAQEPQGWNFLVGTNSADFKTNDFIASKGGMGVFLGVGYNAGYHETYNYQIELAYVQNNINLKNTQLNNKKFGLGGIIQFGVYLNYYLIKPNEDKFYFGPQFGLYTSYGSTTSKEGFDNQEFFAPSGLSGIDLTNTREFNYGTGFGLTGGYNRFRINMRYNLGLSNVLGAISQVSTPGSGNDDKPYSGKISSLSLTLSYRFYNRK